MKNHSISSMLLTFLSIAMSLEATAAESVIVETKYGDIRGTAVTGTTMVGSAITKVNQFTGIPFAAPPVGELRFRSPKPAKAWKPSVYNATWLGNICMQDPAHLESFFKFIAGNATYSENCLFLNVYAPAQDDSRNPTKQYPVMVYIHGGGFVLGSAILTQGNVLAQYGVVVVTIQYRLGPFGFMTTGDSVAPGNYGMLDQVLALKWVKENIASFGGNPNKVTIFGLSAGGASVGLQLLSPLSNNLFHGAISESGVDLSPWVVLKLDVAVAKTLEFARKVGCNDDEHTKVIECLRTKDSWKIVQSFGIEYSRPVIDSAAAGDGAFLPDTPRNLRRAGKFKKIPFMVGYMANEGALFLGQLENATVNLTYFKNSMKDYAMKDGDFLNVIKDKTLIRIIQDALEFQYTPWGETADPLKLRQGIVDVMSDEWFVASSVDVCKIHSAHAPVYLFEFDYRSNFSTFSRQWMGATHGENAAFVFGVPLLNTTGMPAFDAAEKNVSNLLMTMYTNFAKSGNPTPEPLDNGVQWTGFKSTNLAYLHIDPSPEMRSNYKPHRMAFWNDYSPKLKNSVRPCKPPVKGAVVRVPPSLVQVFVLVLGAVTLTFM